MIRQHNAIALANAPVPEVPGLAEHQAAEAQVSFETGGADTLCHFVSINAAALSIDVSDVYDWGD